MSDKKIAVLIGSLRKESVNRKFAHALMARAPAGLQFEIVELGDLPLYNPDLDEDAAAVPPAWTAFRARLADADGVLIVTPEYNRSVPAALKNAIDIGSRPMGQSIWSGKAAGVVSVSPGAIGGFGANHHVRQSLVTLNVAAMPAPEAYIGNAGKLLNEDGKVNNEHTNELLAKFINAFASWVEKNS